MKGNKGFAISGMLYSLLILFLIILLGIMGTLGARKLILDKAKNEVYNDIVDKISQESLAAYKIINEQMPNGTVFADNTGTGVDARLPFSSKYYFRGADPNNYIVFDNVCYRIVNIAQNNSIKIIYEGPAVTNQCNTASSATSGKLTNDVVWNSKNSNNWYDASLNLVSMRKTLIDYAAGNQLQTDITITNMGKVETAIWYVGAVKIATNSLLDSDVANERNFQGTSSLPNLTQIGLAEYEWINKIGMLATSDYVKASGTSACGSIFNGTIADDCKINNFLYKSGYSWWVMHPDSSSLTNSLIIENTGVIATANADAEHAYRPVLYLKSNISISGAGTKANPYKVG